MSDTTPGTDKPFETVVEPHDAKPARETVVANDSDDPIKVETHRVKKGGLDGE